MPVRTSWVVALVCLLSAGVSAQESGMGEAQKLFDEARRLEEQTPSAGAEIRVAYKRAAESFRAVHEGGLNSARLFTNTGNAYYFAGDLGEAALWYSRALLLDPDEERARAGLRLIRRQLTWTPPASVAADLLGTLFFWHSGLPFRVRRGLFLVLWPLAFLLLGLARRKRALLWPGGLCLLAGLALAGSVWISSSRETGADRGVVRVAVEGHTGDGKSYSSSHSAPLPAGSEVRILEERARDEPWMHVELRDASRAWIPSEAVARVIPAS